MIREGVPVPDTRPEKEVQMLETIAEVARHPPDKRQNGTEWTELPRCQVLPQVDLKSYTSKFSGKNPSEILVTICVEMNSDDPVDGSSMLQIFKHEI